MLFVQLEQIGEVQALDADGGMLFVKVSNVKDLQNKWYDWYEDISSVGERDESVYTVQSKWIVSRRWHQSEKQKLTSLYVVSLLEFIYLLDGSDKTLNNRIDQRLQVLVDSSISFDQSTQELAPQDQTVHVLPIVHCLVRLFFLQTHGIAQMNRQLAYIDEHVLISQLVIQRKDLDDRTLHEADLRQSVD